MGMYVNDGRVWVSCLHKMASLKKKKNTLKTFQGKHVCTNSGVVVRRLFAEMQPDGGPFANSRVPTKLVAV